MFIYQISLRLKQILDQLEPIILEVTDVSGLPGFVGQFKFRKLLVEVNGNLFFVFCLEEEFTLEACQVLQDKVFKFSNYCKSKEKIFSVSTKKDIRQNYVSYSGTCSSVRGVVRATG